jgi:hypothetical protein
MILFALTTMIWVCHLLKLLKLSSRVALKDIIIHSDEVSV